MKYSKLLRFLEKELGKPITSTEIKMMIKNLAKLLRRASYDHSSDKST